MKRFDGIEEYRDIHQRLRESGMSEAAQAVKTWAREMASSADADPVFDARRALQRAGLWNLSAPCESAVQWLTEDSDLLGPAR